jgi:hypothetical protein
VETTARLPRLPRLYRLYRPPHLPVRAAPEPSAVGAKDDTPPAWRRLRSAAAVALACAGLVLGPALWLGLAAWASAAGLVLLAVPLGALGLLAAAVPTALALRGDGGGGPPNASG